MNPDHEKSFWCDQAQLDVVFLWSWKSIPSGMKSDQYIKMGMHACSGKGMDTCPVSRNNELSDFGKCNFYRSLLSGKSPSPKFPQ